MTPYLTSDRERRLWLWTIVLVATIWGTLGVAPRLAAGLRATGTMTALFVTGMALVAATAVTHGLRTRAGGAEIAVLFGAAAVYLMVFVRISLPEERTHLIEYGVVAVFVHAALKERVRQGRRVRAPAPIAIVATACLGAIDEGIQWLLPNRVFDPIDIAFNAIAAVMAIGTSLALAWARRFNSSRSVNHR